MKAHNRMSGYGDNRTDDPLILLSTYPCFNWERRFNKNRAYERRMKSDPKNPAARSTSGLSFTWDRDSLDWKGISAAEITKRVTSKVGPGSIILFHNAGEHTPEALPEILRYFAENGYKTVPISEILLDGPYTLDHEGRQHAAPEETR